MDGISWMVRHMANLKPVQHERARARAVDPEKGLEIERLLRTGEYRVSEIAQICGVDDKRVASRKRRMQKAGKL